MGFPQFPAPATGGGTVSSATPPLVINSGVISIPSIATRFENAQQAFLDAIVSGLTYQYVKFGLNPMGLTGSGVGAGSAGGLALDAGVTGGGVTGTAGAYFSATGMIWPDISATKYAWAAECTFPAVSANQNLIGVQDATGTNYAALIADSSYDATHLVLELHKTGVAGTRVVTSFVPDGAKHTIAVTFTGTGGTSTYTVYVDGLSVGSTSTLTNLTSGNRFFAGFNTTAGAMKTHQLLVGY